MLGRLTSPSSHVAGLRPDGSGSRKREQSDTLYRDGARPSRNLCPVALPGSDMCGDRSAVLLYGGLKVIRGTLSPGTFVAYERRIPIAGV